MVLLKPKKERWSILGN